MRRSTLRDYLRGVLVATLPLAGCTATVPPDAGSPVDATTGPAVDATSPADEAVPIVDLATDDAIATVDLAACGSPFDLAIVTTDFGAASSGYVVIVDGGIGPDGSIAPPRTVSFAECRPCTHGSWLSCSVCCVSIAVSCGQSEIGCFPCSCGGRRPEGLLPVDSGDGVGAWLAGAAHLEAASVPAFERLSVELRAHGAPDALVAAARDAVDDERRHARIVGALARAFGAEPPPVGIEAGPDGVRDLERIAVENAVEGCARETYSALAMALQARTAGDRRIRRALAAIVDDEVRHGELAWAVAAWGRHPPRRRRARPGRRARRRAANELVRIAHVPQPRDVVEIAGLPDGVAAVRLASSIAALCA